ncbi:MAG TPA: hypothetical protein VK038_02790 [Ornithinicoccus sp.]|jgi:hypothetical protein|nr:hypothetical protein [Ornithinicoccus sp.]
MTTAATTRRRPQWLRVSAWLLRAYGKLMVWFWGVVVFFAVAILAVVSRFHEVRVSGLQFAQHGALWYPFSLAIILTSAYLGIHVASGLTRRSFALASLVVAASVSLVNAVAATVLLLVERAVYDGLGWYHGLVGEPVTREVLADGPVVHAIGLFVVLTAGMVSGTLVALAYYRFGGLTGTLTLPLSMLPLVVAGLFPVVGSRSWSPWEMSQWADLLPGPAPTLLVLAAGAAAVVATARRIPIAAKEA